MTVEELIRETEWNAAIRHRAPCLPPNRRPGNRDISGNFLLTDVWVNIPNGWRVAERHSSRQEKPPASE